MDAIKEFLIEYVAVLHELATESNFGVALVIAFCAILIFVSVFWLYELFVTGDCLFRKRFIGTGVILSLNMTDRSNLLLFGLPVGTMLMPIPLIRSEEEWNVDIGIAGRTYSLEVSEKTYEKLSVGATISVECVIGRISGKTYVLGPVAH
ncbi:MAG TPA: hypothetical protein VN420_02575 [Candidatus Fimivivens sp.]|nr:hypothetical protein [Candidatus Fimivivens sp.]